MTRTTKYSLALNFILVLIIVLMRGCDPDCPPVVNKGSFPVAKPDHVTITPETVKSPANPKKTPVQTFIDDNRPLVDSLLAENARLQDAYETANDSIKRIMFAERIALRAFSQTWSDDKMKLTVTGIARGEVIGMSADWEYTSVQPKTKDPWRIFANLEIGADVHLDKVTLKPGLTVQTRKGQMFSAAVDNDERIWIGAGLPVFTSK